MGCRGTYLLRRTVAAWHHDWYKPSAHVQAHHRIMFGRHRIVLTLPKRGDARAGVSAVAWCDGVVLFGTTSADG